ncbi:MAG TPA: MarR family transcriptional regulator [Candidatus Aquilonibacter sp.]|nr:MarR family transcriptional regulator [Candidatus Aquilonibacter sp.]
MPVRDIETTGVHLWLVLMKAQHAVEKHALRSIAKSGLCFSDFAVLEILLHKGPLPVNTLGASVSLSSGAATAAIDRLEKKALVRRSADARDRRARVVHLTEKGKTLISGAFREHETDMEALTSGLSPSEKTTLVGLLKKLGKAAASR